MSRGTRLSFLQVAKSFLRWSGKANVDGIQEDIQEPYKQHKVLKQTLSMSSPDFGSRDRVQISFHSQELEIEDNEGLNTSNQCVTAEIKTTNSFKAKYYSQKIRRRPEEYNYAKQNTTRYFIPQRREKPKQPPEKLSRRKFSLKVVSQEGKLEKNIHHFSCPDLSIEMGEEGGRGGRGRVGRKRGRRLNSNGFVVEDEVDTLDRNTSDMFRDSQYLDTELIEIYFE